MHINRTDVPKEDVTGFYIFTMIQTAGSTHVSVQTDRLWAVDGNQSAVAHLTVFFCLFVCSPPPQKWKPKGSVLQHLVSGLCLDSQTPTGPLVITHCRLQVASQSWEPQIITWASAEGEAAAESEPAQGLGLLQTVASLRFEKEPQLYLCDVSFKLLFTIVSVTTDAENIWRPGVKRPECVVSSVSARCCGPPMLLKPFHWKLLYHVAHFSFCMYQGRGFA